jgi:threonine/homoserine/homoserine lactone efflux protein
MPVAQVIYSQTGIASGYPAIGLVVILVIIAVIFGFISGPAILGKLVKGVGDTFRWMTGSK